MKTYMESFITTLIEEVHEHKELSTLGKTAVQNVRDLHAKTEQLRSKILSEVNKKDNKQALRITDKLKELNTEGLQNQKELEEFISGQRQYQIGFFRELWLRAVSIFKRMMLFSVIISSVKLIRDVSLSSEIHGFFEGFSTIINMIPEFLFFVSVIAAGATAISLTLTYIIKAFAFLSNLMAHKLHGEPMRSTSNVPNILIIPFKAINQKGQKLVVAAKKATEKLKEKES